MSELAQETDVQEVKAVYDPTKNYGWEPTDNFNLTGMEYGFILNSMQAEKAECIRKLEMIQILENKLKQAVEDGVAKERGAEKVVPVTPDA